MTVEQLVAGLLKLPPDTVIVLEDGFVGGYSSVIGFEEVTAGVIVLVEGEDYVIDLS